MSPKRALLLVAAAVAVGSLGGALTLGTTPTGSAATPLTPAPPAAPAAAHPVAGLEAAPVQPDSTLTLPTTLHLVERSAGSERIGGSKIAFTVHLTRKGHAVGEAVYTCAASGGVYTCKSAFALSGGVILARLTANSNTGTVSGSVHGGNGVYTGATGTIKGATRSNGTVALTISYSTG